MFTDLFVNPCLVGLPKSLTVIGQFVTFSPLQMTKLHPEKTHQGNHPNISSSCQETINQAFLILPFKTDNQSQCFLKTVFLDGSRRYRQEESINVSQIFVQELKILGLKMIFMEDFWLGGERNFFQKDLRIQYTVLLKGRSNFENSSRI